MARKSGGNIRTILVAGGVIVAIIAVIFIGWWFTRPPAASILGTGEFSIELVDGKTGDVLNDNDFDYILWGVDDDPLDFVGYTEIESASDVGKIGAGDLDGYDFYVTRVNGTVEEEFFDDTKGDRTYYNRYFILTEGAKNTLTVYQQPTDAGFLVWSFVALLLCMTPISQNQFLKGVGFGGASEQTIKSNIYWWSNGLHRFVRKDEASLTPEEAVTELLEKTAPNKPAPRRRGEPDRPGEVNEPPAGPPGPEAG